MFEKDFKMMELYIETLTGTAFELRVSPYETIQDVKARIQKLEGIPMCQQHLIWQSVELEDDYSLQDYSIHDGASLKLVLTMRGGPINTRRIPVDDPTLRDMAEYYFSDPNREEFLEKLPGNRPMTVIVYHNGDQLNFFRVVDRDSTSPMSGSLSGASMYNLCDEEEEEEEDGGREDLKDESLENHKMREKMKSLKLKMENLSLNKKPKKKGLIPRPPSSGRPSSRTKLRRSMLNSTSQKAALTSRSILNPNACLPPVGQSAIDVAEVASLPETKGEESSVPKSTNKCSPTHTVLCSVPKHRIKSPMTQKPSMLSTTKAASEDLKLSPKNCGIPGVSTSKQESHDASGGDKPSTSAAEDSLESILRRAQNSHRTVPRKWDFSQELLTKNGSESSAQSHASSSSSPKKKDMVSLESLKESLRPNTSASKTLECVLEDDNCDSAGPGRPIASRNKDLSLEAFKESLGRPNTSKKLERKQPSVILESLHPSEVRDLSGMLSSIVRSANKSRSSYTLSGGMLREMGRISTPEGRRMRMSASRDGRVMSPANRLPPVKQKKKSSKRCFICGKKTGLASSFQCRCGNNFCATHRYAEMHNCTFDYKTEGRKIIEQANPVVTAPKLPKI